MRRFFPFLIIIFTLSPLSASPVQWTGDGDGLSWSDPENWDTDMIPDASSLVTITNSTVVIDGGIDAFAESIVCSGSLTIDVGSSLTIQDTPLFTPSIEWVGSGNTFLVNGTLNFIDVWVGVTMNGTGGAMTVGVSGVFYIENSLGGVNFPTMGTSMFINDGMTHAYSPDQTCCVAISSPMINTGTMLLEESGGYYGSFENSGTITLDDTDQGIFLAGSESINTGTINIATEDIGVVYFLDGSVLTNSGSINLTGAGEYAIQLYRADQLLNNLSSGQINISNAILAAIRMESDNGDTFILNNDGQISIDNVAGDGLLFMNSTINNNVGGSILIHGVSTGFKASSGTNQFTNMGIVEVTGTILRGVDMVNPLSDIENGSTGVMTLDSIGTTAIAGDIVNAGSITITNGGNNVALDGDVINNGDITMMNLSNGGTFGSFLNSGTVTLNTLGATAFSVFGDDVFDNSGMMTILDVQGTKMNVNGSSTAWSNSGDITISGGSGNGLSLTQVGSASQTSTGSMSISNGNAGLRVSDCGFSLDGSITISNTFTGVAASTDADFEIQPSGVLNIADCNRGFFASTGAICENNGLIDMSGLIATEALSVRTNAQFANFIDGVITIDKSGITSIVLDGGTFVNLGEMHLKSNFTTIGNLGDFQNKPTGTVNILEFGNVGLANGFGGIFTNQGTLDITKNGSPVDIQNIDGGTLINTGTIIARN